MATWPQINLTYHVFRFWRKSWNLVVSFPWAGHGGFRLVASTWKSVGQIFGSRSWPIVLGPYLELRLTSIISWRQHLQDPPMSLCFRVKLCKTHGFSHHFATWSTPLPFTAVGAPLRRRTDVRSLKSFLPGVPWVASDWGSKGYLRSPHQTTPWCAPRGC